MNCLLTKSINHIQLYKVFLSLSAFISEMKGLTWCLWGEMSGSVAAK